MTSNIDISPTGKEIKIWFHDKLIGHAKLSLKPMPHGMEIHLDEVIKRNNKAQ